MRNVYILVYLSSYGLEFTVGSQGMVGRKDCIVLAKLFTLFISYTTTARQLDL